MTHLQSVSRSAGCQIIGEEVLASCLNGPRGNEQLISLSVSLTVIHTLLSSILNDVHAL